VLACFGENSIAAFRLAHLECLPFKCIRSGQTAPVSIHNDS